MDKPVVVISSTNEDLSEYRKIVIDLCEELGMDAEYQEREISDGKSTGSSTSLDLVERAMWYVGIIAWRYGKCAPGSNKSFTELEYERARERELPLYIFFLPDKASWPLDLVDENRSAIRAFRSRIREQDNQFCHSFVDKSTFHDEVLKVLSGAKTKWEIERVAIALIKVLGIKQRTIGTVMSGPVSSAIVRIAALKSMHDALHGILQTCISPLFDQVLGTLAPEATEVAEDGALIEARRAFDAGQTALVAGRGEARMQVIDRCIRDLNFLAQQWDKFQMSRQRRELEDIAHRIEGAIRQPFWYLNNKLMDESSALDVEIPPVVKALGEALAIARNDARAIDVQLIEARIKELQETRLRLQSSIEEHNLWQDVHDTLQSIDTRAGIPAEYHEAIIAFWNAKSALCLRLAEQRNDLPATQLKSACIAFHTRLNRGSSGSQLWEGFRYFRQCFDQAFYHVDWALNQLCQSLADRAREVLAVLNALADEIARKIQQWPKQ